VEGERRGGGGGLKGIDERERERDRGKFSSALEFKIGN